MNSLAALNAANVVKAKDKYKNKKEEKKLDIEDNTEKIKAIMEEKKEEENKNK